MEKNNEDIEDVYEDIFRHHVGGNEIQAFLKCEETALKNGCFPNTLEEIDLPPEVLKQIKIKSVEQIYPEGIIVEYRERNDGRSINRLNNFKNKF